MAINFETRNCHKCQGEGRTQKTKKKWKKCKYCVGTGRIETPYIVMGPTAMQMFDKAMKEQIKSIAMTKKAMFQLDDDNDFREHFVDQVQRMQKELSEYAEQKYQAFLEDAVRNKANPPVEGEITREKLDNIGIKIVHEQGTGRKWVEQNGTCISEIFDEREFFKLK